MSPGALFQGYASLDIKTQVLATTAPFHRDDLACIIHNIAEGLAVLPHLQKRLTHVYEQLQNTRELSCAGAICEVYKILAAEKVQEAKQEFELAFVRVLQGRKPNRAKPSFKSILPSRTCTIYLDASAETSSSEPCSESGSSRFNRKRRRVHLDLASAQTLPSASHREQGLQYKSVPVITNQANAVETIEALRFAGTPFIIEGHNFIKYSKKWVSDETSELHTKEFLKGLSDLEVPVLRRDYEVHDPIKKHMRLGEFVRRFWNRYDATYYMHQWQFPLNPNAAELLCHQCEDVPFVGKNMLSCWLDTIRGDNPLQYLFMGGKGTRTRMHQDTGGLDIVIAPISGSKRVKLLHRSASQFDSMQEQNDFEKVDFDTFPLVAFLPAWSADIQPGQILYIPAGTYHACENISRCLSHHHFHLDTVNIPSFLASFVQQDAPTIDHGEILWNAAHDVMLQLERNQEKYDRLDLKSNSRDLASLRGLRHAVCYLSLEQAVPTAWNWKELLNDIDVQLSQIGKHRTKESHSKVSTDPSSESQLRHIKSKPPNEPSEISNWRKLDIHVGDTVLVRGFSHRRCAMVKEIALDTAFVYIHYDDWDSIYDEYRPLNSVFYRDRQGRLARYKEKPLVKQSVLVRWGPNMACYKASVLKVVQSHGCLVQYLRLQQEWNQWILSEFIFHNKRNTKSTC